MARTAIVVESVTRSGLNPTQQNASVANGHELSNNDGLTVLRIDNGGGSPSVVSADIKQQVDGVDPPDKTLSVAAGAVRYFGPFNKDIYGEIVWIDFDVDTSVTFECIRIPKS
jgi:hypothetical protein